MNGEIYKADKKKLKINRALSMSTILGTLGFLICWIIFSRKPADPSVFNEIIELILPMTITAIIFAIIFIIMQNKIRTTLWMANLVISVLYFGRAGMFVVLALWIIDEYIFWKKWQELKTDTRLEKKLGA